MKTFLTSYNNGVNALVSSEVLRDILKADSIDSALNNDDVLGANPFNKVRESPIEAGLCHIRKGPIFTFTDAERVARSPWFTGNNDTLAALVAHIEQEGGQVLRGGCYVPFSNGMELGMHGLHALEKELSLVTTSLDFSSTFGITLAELERKVKAAGSSK